MNFAVGFDGGNAKAIACYGYTVMTQDDKGVITVTGEGYGKCHDELQTSNVAEWTGLFHGLMCALPQILTLKRECEIDKLLLCGDSQLVLRQLTGEYSVTKEHLRYYHSKCKSLVARIEQEGVVVVTNWDRRDTNKRADELTHVARRRYLGE